MNTITLTQDALSDIDYAYQYYIEHVSASTADRLLSEIENNLKQIKEFADANPKHLVHEGNIVYKKHLNKFKYTIFYLIQDEIIVFALLHQSRNIENLIAKRL